MGERKIKVAFKPVVCRVMISASVSSLGSIIFWKHLSLPQPYALASIAVSTLLLLFLFQLRFLPQMTIAVWTSVWGSIAPFLVGSLFTFPMLPFFPVLALVFFLLISVGIWAAYRFYPFLLDTRLHKARFARHDEMETLFCKNPCDNGLVLGRVRQFLLFHHFVCVRPTPAKKEIGNSLILA